MDTNTFSFFREPMWISASINKSRSKGCDNDSYRLCGLLYTHSIYYQTYILYICVCVYTHICTYAYMFMYIYTSQKLQKSVHFSSAHLPHLVTLCRSTIINISLLIIGRLGILLTITFCTVFSDNNYNIGLYRCLNLIKGYP